MYSRNFLLIFFLFNFTCLFAQKNNGYQITDPDFSYGIYCNVPSKSMNKSFPALIFTPTDYLKSNKAYPVVYMLHGTNSMQLNEKGIREMYNPSTKMREMAEMFKTIIVAPLVGNTYYLNSPLMKENLYATFISCELTNFVDENYRTLSERNGRILCGFSMGGYGAVSLLCRYPDIFSIAIERAGVLNLATNLTDLNWDKIDENITTVLGDYYTHGENYHLNSCFNLINHIRERKDISFVIEVGREDFLYKTNQSFHQKLLELHIPHIYNETEGGHEWNANSLRSLLSNLQYFRQTQF